jgi:Flp pilus assembly protein CpaB
MVARVVVAVVALAAAGLLAVQERAARATDRITATALADPDPQRLAAARADLPTARRWNPDTIPAQDLAVAEARAGHYEQAGERLLAVTRQEPENARAFDLLCSIAKRYDSDLAGTACARLRALAPPVGSLKRSSGRSTR